MSAKDYEFITAQLKRMRDNYPSLRSKPDEYVFSALCIEVGFYKNPELILSDDDLSEMIVDGKNDGGADFILNDPNSEDSDLIIGQSKFHKSISQETILNAMLKMARFYNDMADEHSEKFSERVRRQFSIANAERSDDSKIRFVFYTSAPQKNIDTGEIEKHFRETLKSSSAVEVSILFESDIVNEVNEAAARSPTVKNGKIQIDDKNNYLEYGDEAVIVNVSALSIKKLHDRYGISLLSRNLRYYIKGSKLDKEIRDTIDNNREMFWLMNNGITIICDSFELDGNKVKLRNFSIVNGGQTTCLLANSKNINAEKNLYLPCKIIKVMGDTEDEKNNFILKIAKAANSQKPIKDADLKANTPEQIRFARAMREVGILYQTKRGETIPPQFQDACLHTKLEEVGKLCLAAIFQEPCKSRSNPSVSYKDSRYYNPVFNAAPEKTKQIARVCKDLLYIDWYFDKKFRPKFEHDNKNSSDYQIPFARLARRICVAFAALAARYHQGNLTNEGLEAIFNASEKDNKNFYETVRDLGEIKSLLPENADVRDAILNKLFTAIIEEGAGSYSFARDSALDLTLTNYFKLDKNYYKILKIRWSSLKRTIREVFANN